MKESKLTYLIDPLREMLYQFDVIIKGFRERSGLRIAAITCGMLPNEIAACAGLLPLRLPFFAHGRCACEGLSMIEKIEELYDCLVVPQGCAGKGAILVLPIPVHEFKAPQGWGAQSYRLMEAALDELLQLFGGTGFRESDVDTLRAAVREYNAVRRLVRGIASVRRGKPDLLSCRDLAVVFEAAAVLPPSIVIGYLAPILDRLNDAASGCSGGMIPALAYASFINDASILDEIEEAGCLIVEDDFCSGRRQFEMSYDHESDNLIPEILDSFSYRPGCPSVRPAEERVELFYKMIKGEGVELVIFLEDLCCGAKKRDIEALRIRLMRSGVDPLVVSTADAVEKVRDYVATL